MATPRAIHAWMIECDLCDRQVVVFANSAPTEPPNGWIEWFDDWVCPKHKHHYDLKEEYATVSEADYVVVEGDDDEWT